MHNFIAAWDIYGLVAAKHVIKEVHFHLVSGMTR